MGVRDCAILIRKVLLSDKNSCHSSDHLTGLSITPSSLIASWVPSISIKILKSSANYVDFALELTSSSLRSAVFTLKCIGDRTPLCGIPLDISHTGVDSHLNGSIRKKTFKPFRNLIMQTYPFYSVHKSFALSNALAKSRYMTPKFFFSSSESVRSLSVSSMLVGADLPLAKPCWESGIKPLLSSWFKIWGFRNSSWIQRSVRDRKKSYRGYSEWRSPTWWEWHHLQNFDRVGRMR